jgi:cold shock CspA family protein
MKVTGRINVWFADRNYGFIHQNLNGTVVKHFLHASNILSGVPQKSLTASFDTIQGEKGSVALNVEILHGGVQS